MSETRSRRTSEAPCSKELPNTPKRNTESNDRGQLVPEISLARETKTIYPTPDGAALDQSRVITTEESRNPDALQVDKPITDPKFSSISKNQPPILHLGHSPQASGSRPDISNGLIKAENVTSAGNDNAFASPVSKGKTQTQLTSQANKQLLQDDVRSRSAKLSQGGGELLQEQVNGSHAEERQLQVPASAHQIDVKSSPSMIGAWSPNASNAAQLPPNKGSDNKNFINEAQATSAKKDERMEAYVSDPTQADTVQVLPLPAPIPSQPAVPATPDAQLRLEEQQASALEQRALSLTSMEVNQAEPTVGQDARGTPAVQEMSRSKVKAVPFKTPEAPQALDKPLDGHGIDGPGAVKDNEQPLSERPYKISDIALRQNGTGLAPKLTDRDVEMSNAPSMKPDAPRHVAGNDDLRQENFSKKTNKHEDRKEASQTKTPRSAITSPLLSGPKATLNTNRQPKPYRRTSSKSAKLRLGSNKDDFAKSVDIPHIDPEYINLKGAAEEGRDYLLPLFQWQAHQPPRATPLLQLLGTSHKVLSTSSHFVGLWEEQDARILRRIHQLQSTNRWSFRQLERCQEPPRVKSHLDSLLGEMRWLQVDFEQERKWKSLAALNLASWCAEWVQSSSQKRRSLQIKVRTGLGTSQLHRPDLSAVPNVINEDSEMIQNGIQAGEEVSEEDLDDFHSGTPSSAAIQLAQGGMILYVEPMSEPNDILDRIPWYDPDKEETPDNDSDMLSSDKAPSLLPVSKFINSKLVPLSNAPVRKRSRYEYEEEEELEASNSNHHKRISSIDSIHSIHSVRSMSMLTSGRTSRSELPPEQIDVALFNPENKHVRDRLHAGHAFRPPSEFGMPSTSFFESRISSQWLWDEDQKLRSLVREYSYNWSLISASLALPSNFTSGAERRTPWECFERWVQLEGLPAEMSKTPYFKTYQSRLEAAQRTVSAQHQAAQQQAQQPTQISGQQQLGTSARRRTTKPIRVERRKNTRYLAWIDCMRKLARRRETVQHKQQEGQ